MLLIKSIPTADGYSFVYGTKEVAIGAYINSQFELLENNNVTVYNNAMQALKHLGDLYENKRTDC